MANQGVDLYSSKCSTYSTSASDNYIILRNRVVSDQNIYRILQSVANKQSSAVFIHYLRLTRKLANSLWENHSTEQTRSFPNFTSNLILSTVQPMLVRTTKSHYFSFVTPISVRIWIYSSLYVGPGKNIWPTYLCKVFEITNANILILCGHLISTTPSPQ